MIRPALRRGLAENAVARHGVSIALACRTFDVSETCYRYSPFLSDENEEIADLLVGLTAARKTWGFGLCFLHLRNVQNHCRDLRHGYDHLLHYLRVAQVVITLNPASFQRCYGPENVSGFLKTWAATRGIHSEDIQSGKPQQNAYIERYNRTVQSQGTARMAGPEHL